jgi:hypothetical protein
MSNQQKPMVERVVEEIMKEIHYDEMCDRTEVDSTKAAASIDALYRAHIKEVAEKYDEELNAGNVDQQGVACIKCVRELLRRLTGEGNV